jgi:predicted enzyme related to lactoylglutathione lyase
MNRFGHYELRTTDAQAARGFYDDLLGPSFWEGCVSVTALPPQAAARGAPAHWLGHIGVDDVVGAMLHFVERGATQLGPAPRAGAAERVVLRDPNGAIVALAPLGTDAREGRVAWHVLCARDEATAFATYADLFGWTSCGTVDLGAERGRHVSFTWDEHTGAVGSISNLACRPYVHPQWLFFFPTTDLDESLARVRDSGGRALPTFTTAEGSLVAPCDDPQGAAFALIQAAVP